VIPKHRMSTNFDEALPRAMRILIIDDDEVDRMRARRLLGRIPGHAFEIEEAVDVAGGIAAIAGRPHDCILLDFRLPDGDALELLKKIEAAKGECPPIILQTVLDDESTAVEAVAAGAQDYLIKGRFDSTLLFRSIRYAIQRDRLIKEHNRLLHDLQQALARVKALEGMLPICSSCKKIRDDKGTWNAIEAYVEEHSNTTFTHSICPDCLRKLYPNLKIKQ
jgi:DNA-binding NarL/FixJ family response regulator